MGPAIPAERLYDCVNVILSYQNADGGMATYENTRSFHWLEVRAERVLEDKHDTGYCICCPVCCALPKWRGQSTRRLLGQVLECTSTPLHFLVRRIRLNAE